MTQAPERIWRDPYNGEMHDGSHGTEGLTEYVTLSHANAMVGVCHDVRKWSHYPIEMPLTANGQGPAALGVDASVITYEVWDHEFTSHSSHDNLPDAINSAYMLSFPDAQAALDRLLAEAREEGRRERVEVRPLEWKGLEHFPFVTTDVGQYQVRESESGWYVQLDSFFSTVIQADLPNKQSGIDVANNHYERRILSALQEQST